MPYPVLVGGLIAAGLLALVNVLRTKKIFVSYYYKGDNKYKNMLKAWSANEKFDFDFEDVSADVSIRSRNSEVIRETISKKIRDADVVLVLVGERSHKRKWVRWEIAKARNLEKRIVAVKVKPHFQSPRELLSAGATWAKSFDFEAIKNAIE